MRRGAARGLVAFVLGVGAVAGAAGCSDETAGRDAPADPGPGVFEDVTLAGGVDFTHVDGATGELTLAEITGAGGALFDADGDGDLDLYLVQGGPLPGGRAAPAGSAPDAGSSSASGALPRDHLFRNDGAPAPGAAPRFTDVTDASGIVAERYGMGAAVGDVDNDGDLDLLVTNLGPDQLFANRGDGRFEDVSAVAGIADPRWTTSAAFFDADRDGFLDLFVVAYVDASGPTPRCFALSSAPDHCGPDAYPPLPDRFYRNRGDGSFADASGQVGIAAATGAGLGVITDDFDGDGHTDVYVANDGDANRLWLWREGRFVDEALLAGVALNRMGRPEASMGVASADLDGDGRPELFMTHLDGESNTLYANLGGGLFEDRTLATGLHAPSLPYTGFGTGFLDADGDGDLDLLTLNGAVRLPPGGVRADDPAPLAQRDLLFENRGDGNFAALPPEAAPTLARPGVSRGALFGDLDDDGTLDLVATANGGPARVLLNRGARRGRWLGLRLLDPETGRDALGARVELQLEGGGSRWATVRTDGSYASARDPRALFRLGDARPRAVRVHAPGGGVETRAVPALDAYHTWTLGGGDR